MDNSEHPSIDVDDDVVEKLDGGLRRLLRMSDEEVVEAIESAEARLNEDLQRFEDFVDELPSKAADEDGEAIERLRAHYRTGIEADHVLGSVVMHKAKLIPIRVRALVHFTGNREDLVSMGLDVGVQAQDIFTVVGTRAQLAHLATQAATLHVCLPRPLLPTVEKAGAQAEIHAVHSPRYNNPTGYKGKGVIVGIVDSALDVTHHGFRNPSPTGGHGSRVLYYWVRQPDDPKAPGVAPYYFDTDFAKNEALKQGRLYTRQAIDTALALSGGPYGNGVQHISKKPGSNEHGTRVAGIAAGSGHRADWTKTPEHVGAAPQADLVHVYVPESSSFAMSFEDSVLAGIDFIFRAADKHHMPAVVNVSMASQLGPHNGSTLFDKARDNLLNSERGRCIVWAAGNGNDDQGHKTGTVGHGATETLTLTHHKKKNWIFVDLWYSGPELEVQLESEGVASNWCKQGSDEEIPNGLIGGYKVAIRRDTKSGDGLRNVRISAFWLAKFVKPLTIRLRNPSSADEVKFDAWVGISAGYGSLDGATQDELTLSDTACGRSILTVGACQKRLPPSPSKGEAIAAYSGAGPTLDGRIKPEIVTVGGTSALDIETTESDQASGYDGDWGTSMAAPLVTGAAALLFDAYRKYDLTPDTVKALLTQTANRQGLHVNPEEPAYIAKERNQYGYGRLRMIAPIDHIAPLVDVDVWIRTAADDYGTEPFPGNYFWNSPDIKVAVPGTNQEITELKWGESYSVIVTIRNLGNSKAAETHLRLRYTLPGTAPNDWAQARDPSGTALDTHSFSSFTIPAMNQFVITFTWRPLASDIGAPPGTTHFCLLAEADHPLDKLSYPDASTAGHKAWARSIKRTNNVALQNVHIY